MDPKSIKKFALWSQGTLLLTFWEMFPHGMSNTEHVILAAKSAKMVDQTILKMMGKDDE